MKTSQQHGIAGGLAARPGTPGRLRPRTTYPTVSRLSLQPTPLHLLLRAAQRCAQAVARLVAR